MQLNYWSQKTIDLIMGQLPKQRELFKQEYSHALINQQDFDLHCGFRFYNDERVLRNMQFKYTEENALVDTAQKMQYTLLGLASADHWYTFEKEY
jgi:hypothetical protein